VTYGHHIITVLHRETTEGSLWHQSVGSVASVLLVTIYRSHLNMHVYSQTKQASKQASKQVGR